MLTTEQIVAHWNKHQDVRSLGRFVEVEVRKQDEALIRQMLAALNLCCTAMDYLSEDERIGGAIEAAHAHLQEKAP